MGVTVVTPAIPSRFHLLRDALNSVRAQSFQPDAHLVGIDHAGRGSAATVNALVAGVRSEWFVILDDDDVIYEKHLETLVANSADADVVYCWADMRDWPDWSTNKHNLNRAAFDPARLRFHNYIPGSCALIRTELYRKVGGQPEGDVHGHDWQMWLRILDAGGRFRLVPEVHWYYRRHEGQKQAELHGIMR